MSLFCLISDDEQKVLIWNEKREGKKNARRQRVVFWLPSRLGPQRGGSDGLPDEVIEEPGPPLDAQDPRGEGRGEREGDGAVFVLFGFEREREKKRTGLREVVLFFFAIGPPIEGFFFCLFFYILLSSCPFPCSKLTRMKQRKRCCAEPAERRGPSSAVAAALAAEVERTTAMSTSMVVAPLKNSLLSFFSFFCFLHNRPSPDALAAFVATLSTATD